jgi:hypothetical protein
MTDRTWHYKIVILFDDGAYQDPPYHNAGPDGTINQLGEQGWELNKVLHFSPGGMAGIASPMGYVVFRRDAKWDENRAQEQADAELAEQSSEQIRQAFNQ